MSKGTTDLQTLVKSLQANEKASTDKKPTYHFFKREYSFSCYGFQAIIIAEEYYKTKRVVRHEQGLECVDISRKLLAKIGGSLLDRSYNIGIWHKSNPSPSSPWELYLEATPGNFSKLEEELGSLEKDASSSCYSMCVAIADYNPLLIGVTLISSVTRQIDLYKLLDDDEYSRLRSLVLRFNIETVYIAVHGNANRLQTLSKTDINDQASSLSPTPMENNVRKVLTRFDVTVNFVPLEFVKGGTESRRTKTLSELELLKMSNLSSSSIISESLHVSVDRLDLWLSIDAAGALLYQLRMWGDRDYKDTFRIEPGYMTDILLYDRNVLDVLQIFPQTDAPLQPISEEKDSTTLNGTSKIESSLFGVLNETKSKMGSRLLRQWLQHPLRDKALIEERQNAISSFLQNVDKMNMLRESREYMKNFPDMERLALRLKSTQIVANAGNVLKDMLDLYKCTLKAASIGEILASTSCDPGASSLGLDLVEQCKVFQKLHALMEELIDIDHMQRLSFNANIRAAAVKERESCRPLSLYKDRYYRVKPSFSTALTKLYESLVSTEDQIVSCYSDLQKRLNHDSKDLHLEDSPVHGLHFRVTKRLSPKILKAMDSAKTNYEILSNQKAGTLFITRDMKALVQKFSNLRTRYQEEQISIVQQALEVVQSYTIPALKVASQIAKIDALLSLAFQALQNDWIRPELHSTGDIPDDKTLNIKGLRHAILEHRIGAIAVVPNDVKVSHNDGYCMIITGPNMGGKSTFMRSVGLAVLMAQIGSFIPATSAVMPIYDQLFVRSGSSDLSAIGYSSFMAEMVDTADIIRSATVKSLVLIDELGRGTSTCDGFGIAWAILEELAQRNKSTVFCATHFHELNNLSLVSSGQMDKNNDLPIYKCLYVDAHIDKNFQDVSMLYQVKEGSCFRSYGIHVAKVANFPEEIISKALEIEENLNNKSQKKQNKRSIDEIENDSPAHSPCKHARDEQEGSDDGH